MVGVADGDAGVGGGEGGSEVRKWFWNMQDPARRVENGKVFAGMIDRGTVYIDPKTGEKKQFVDENGQPCIGLLDGKGGPLADGDPPHVLWFEVGEP